MNTTETNLYVNYRVGDDPKVYTAGPYSEGPELREHVMDIGGYEGVRILGALVYIPDDAEDTEAK